MGNSLNKKKIVVVPTFHPMNQPIDTDQFYEILEYWFSTVYTQEDKEKHIIDINPPPEPEIPIQIEIKKQKIQEEKAKKEKLKPLGYWDCHTSIHFDAISKWHMTDPEMIQALKLKFEQFILDRKNEENSQKEITPSAENEENNEKAL